MNLAALRQEVLNHGFDPVIFSPSRLNQYLNDAYQLACRRTQFYSEENTQDFSTVSGTAKYALPADFAVGRSLRRTDVGMEMAAVGLRDIDRSNPNTTGAPFYYALDALNMHLYPTPNGVYTMELRYWVLPAQLVNDADTPIIPDTWQRMLWYWAVRESYAAEDDSQTAQYWEQQFNTTLSEFEADVRFPNSDMPTVAKGWLDSGDSLSPSGWGPYGNLYG